MREKENKTEEQEMKEEVVIRRSQGERKISNDMVFKKKKM